MLISAWDFFEESLMTGKEITVIILIISGVIICSQTVFGVMDFITSIIMFSFMVFEFGGLILLLICEFTGSDWLDKGRYDKPLLLVFLSLVLMLTFDFAYKETAKNQGNKIYKTPTYQSYTPKYSPPKETSPPQIENYGLKPANGIKNDNDKIINDSVTTPQHSEMYKKFNESINDEYNNNTNSQNTEIPKVENPERNFPTYTPPPSNFKMPSESEIQEYRKSIEESYKKFDNTILKNKE